MTAISEKPPVTIKNLQDQKGRLLNILGRVTTTLESNGKNLFPDKVQPDSPTLLEDIVEVSERRKGIVERIIDKDVPSLIGDRINSVDAKINTLAQPLIEKLKDLNSQGHMLPSEQKMFEDLVAKLPAFPESQKKDSKNESVSIASNEDKNSYVAENGNQANGYEHVNNHDPLKEVVENIRRERLKKIQDYLQNKEGSKLLLGYVPEAVGEKYNHLNLSKIKGIAELKGADTSKQFVHLTPQLFETVAIDFVTQRYSDLDYARNWINQNPQESYSVGEVMNAAGRKSYNAHLANEIKEIGVSLDFGIPSQTVGYTGEQTLRIIAQLKAFNPGMAEAAMKSRNHANDDLGVSDSEQKNHNTEEQELKLQENELPNITEIYSVASLFKSNLIGLSQIGFRLDPESLKVLDGIIERTLKDALIDPKNPQSHILSAGEKLDLICIDQIKKDIYMRTDLNAQILLPILTSWEGKLPSEFLLFLMEDHSNKSKEDTGKVEVNQNGNSLNDKKVPELQHQSPEPQVIIFKRTEAAAKPAAPIQPAYVEIPREKVVNVARPETREEGLPAELIPNATDMFAVAVHINASINSLKAMGFDISESSGNILTAIATKNGSGANIEDANLAIKAGLEKIGKIFKDPEKVKLFKAIDISHTGFASIMIGWQDKSFEDFHQALCRINEANIAEAAGSQKETTESERTTSIVYDDESVYALTNILNASNTRNLKTDFHLVFAPHELSRLGTILRTLKSKFAETDNALPDTAQCYDIVDLRLQQLVDNGYREVLNQNENSDARWLIMKVFPNLNGEKEIKRFRQELKTYRPI